MSAFDIKVESYVRDVLNVLHNQRVTALNEVGFQVRAHVNTLVPRDTGTLARSFNHVVDDDSVTIGTSVEYGKYVEANDNARHTNGKAHFLRDSVQGHLSEYNAIITRRLKG